MQLCCYSGIFHQGSEAQKLLPDAAYLDQLGFVWKHFNGIVYQQLAYASDVRFQAASSLWEKLCFSKSKPSSILPAAQESVS